MRKNLFATTPGIIIVGAVIGLIAVWLQKLGNPANMGICVACFERDVAGGLGLHRAAIVQYLRPEIMGLVLGSLAAAIATREFKPRGGSAPIVRFVLGMIAAMGALVFLGCPWRAILRLAGGDGNAILGLAGLATGIWFGTLFFKKGYSLGRSNSQSVVSGALFPVIAVCLLLLYLIFPQIPDQPQSGPLFYSVKGPGSQHAPFIASLGLAFKAELEAARQGVRNECGGEHGRQPEEQVGVAEEEEVAERAHRAETAALREDADYEGQPQRSDEGGVL